MPVPPGPVPPLQRGPLFVDDLHAGVEIPSLIKHPSPVALFRFSAVTWNAHRIHYDRDYAAAEGYPNVLVQGHLHGAYLTQMLLTGLDPPGSCAGSSGATGAPRTPATR